MAEIERPLRPTLATPVVAVIRVVLVALAACAVVAAWWISRADEPSAGHRYVCPMHGEVTSSAPGDCPICGMALEEIDATSRAAMLRAPSTTAAGEQVGFAQLRVSYEATMLMRFAVAAARRNAVPGEVFAPAIVAPDGEIIAQLYRDELASLAPDERADWQPGINPEAGVAIRRDSSPPVVASASDAIARVGFRAEPGGPVPPPGQVGWVKLGYKSRAMLIVRSAAILPSPDGPYVLVFSNPRGGLTRRRIEIGKDYAGMTAVVSGLRDKEFVVMANAFSVDAERRLQAVP
jgi:heavy metal-binding protein